MSNIIFTPPPGLSWSVFKAPSFNTIVQPAASGKTTRASLQANPIWTFKLTWEYLRDLNATISDVDSLMDFFLARLGSFDTFLYNDPSDNAVTTQNFGTGDAITTTFQLTRSLGGNFKEVIQNLNGAPSIFVGGVLKTAGVDYSIGATGIVTFAAAPGSSVALTWTGGYYFRVRFKSDIQEFEQFMQNLWTVKTMELISELL